MKFGNFFERPVSQEDQLAALNASIELAESRRKLYIGDLLNFKSSDNFSNSKPEDAHRIDKIEETIKTLTVQIAEFQKKKEQIERLQQQ